MRRADVRRRRHRRDVGRERDQEAGGGRACTARRDEDHDRRAGGDHARDDRARRFDRPPGVLSRMITPRRRASALSMADTMNSAEWDGWRPSTSATNTAGVSPEARSRPGRSRRSPCPTRRPSPGGERPTMARTEKRSEHRTVAKPRWGMRSCGMRRSPPAPPVSSRQWRIPLVERSSAAAGSAALVSAGVGRVTWGCPSPRIPCSIITSAWAACQIPVRSFRGAPRGSVVDQRPFFALLGHDVGDLEAEVAGVGRVEQRGRLA